ncbi:MAG: recombination mediator RecR [Candidatus Staskawiczbacteria bacterium]|nr:recombination mediator RecR [Candidatus Staskawiczbacteria bacterium]
MANSINKLINLFSKFPTVGPRTASRFVFYLIKLPKDKIDELINTITELKTDIKFCKFCFNPFEQDNFNQSAQTGLCPICQNSSRDKHLLCVIEKETDLTSIENTKKYNGLYFILGGTIATMKKNETDSLRIKELLQRIKPPSEFKEIIIATNPTPEGKATSVLIERALKELIPINFKITHLAQGLPVGGELEYADEETLESAFEGRK